jgi:esterase/lipase
MGNFEQVKKFIQRIEVKKDKIISIREFKSLFEHFENDTKEIQLFNKVFRIMSFKFIKEEILPYLL